MPEICYILLYLWEKLLYHIQKKNPSTGDFWETNKI